MDADLDRRLLRFRNLSKKEDAGSLARDLLSVDRTRDAMEVAATGLRRRPDNAGLVVVLGRVLLEGGDLERAQEAFLQASKMDRGDAEALRYLGETLLRRGDAKRAAKVLGRAVALDDEGQEIRRLHERANRLARGMAVRPDPELDPPVVDEPARLTSDAPPAERSARTSSSPPRSRKRTLMMGSEPPEELTDTTAEAADEPNEPRQIQSSPSIRVSEVGDSRPIRARRQTTPHGVARVQAAKSTLMLDPSAMPNASPQPEQREGKPTSESPVQPRSVTIDHESLPEPQPTPNTDENVEVDLDDGPDAEIVVERHAPEPSGPKTQVASRRTTDKRLVEERPKRKTPWLLLLALPLLIAVLAFVAVRKFETKPESKENVPLLRALLQPDKAELRALAQKGPSERERVLAAAHLAYREGLKSGSQLESLLPAAQALQAGEADAARATLELLQGNIKSAVEAARKSTMSPRPTTFATYLAGRTLASVGLPEGETLLREALQAEPTYRDATLALAMFAYLQQGKEEAQRALRTAPSDDVDAIVPLYRSAVENPTAPEKRTKTDHDLIAKYGASSELIRRFVHGKPSELESSLKSSGVRDPLNLALAAQVALDRDAPGPAVAAALLAQKLVPDHAGIRRIVAKSAFALNDPSAAWDALAGTHEHDEESLLMLGRTAAQTNNTDYMKDALARINARKIADDPRLLALSIELRSALSEEHDEHEELLAEAKSLSAAHPGNIDALRALVRAAKDANDAGAEKAALEELVRAAPQDASAHLEYGRYWQSLGDFEKAETGYSRALSLAPNEREAAVLLGELLLTHGHYGKAELHYRNDVPAGPEAVIGRTQALAASGRNVDGLAELEKAMKFDPLSPALRFKLANAALLLARPDHAEALVKDIAKKEDADVEVIVAYAKALSALGKAEQATEQLDRALRTAPGSIAALLAKSEAAVHAGKPATAHKYLALVYPKIGNKKTPEPIKAQYWLLRGRAYLLEGAKGLDDAREALRGAVRYRGTLPEAYFFLGESLASANSPEAAKAYADYVALAPNGQFIKRAERALGTKE